MPKRYTHLIIGAGPTGLGAAYRLKELGEEDFLILERSPHAGGLASSFKDERGFTWDIGGHVHFSHYKEYDEALDSVLPKDAWRTFSRHSSIYIEGRFVPFPIQHNIGGLRFPTALKSAFGMLAGNKTRTPKNFDEWMVGTFGKGLTDVFMRPYNIKTWAYPPERLGYSWTGERIAMPRAASTLLNVLLRRSSSSWGPNKTFRFPKEGGTGGVWKAIADKVGAEHFVYGASVASIDTERKEVHTTDGKAYGYTYILNTMPLDVLVPLITPALPEATRSAAKQLLHSSVHIVGLGMKGETPEHLRDKNWMYFPESNCPFYRATVFSNYSSSHVPDPARNWSLMLETSSSPWKPIKKETVVEEVIQECLNTRLIKSRDEIVSTWTYASEYGYPTPSLERDELLDKVLAALEEHGIQSRGRFGGWKYEVSNQDHSFMQGYEWANRVVKGTPETTLFYPAKVNTGTPRS